MPNNNPKKILLIDDNTAIHDDYRKILLKNQEQTSINAAKAILFGDADGVANKAQADQELIIDSAYQGQEAVELVRKAKSEGKPYTLAFVDIRMPPGWDGIMTIQKIWEVDPDIQIVICSAYSDYSFEDISDKLKVSDSFLILKKPFDIVEIRQMASALTSKWDLHKHVRYQIENLQSLVSERTIDLDKTVSLIKTTLDSTLEGIIAFGVDDKIITYNKVFLNLWGIDEDKLTTPSAVFQFLSDQVDESESFLKMMKNISTKPNESKTEEWKLKNGKILEVYAHPNILHDNTIGTVYSFRDITERRNFEKRLSHQATHDILTGLPNRALLTIRIEEAIKEAQATNLLVGILLIDLDNFKSVNDSLGHNVGDLLLQSLANSLHTSVRECDTFARFGGDEFVLVLTSQIDTKTIMAIANDFLKLLTKPFLIEDHEIIVTASIGISVYPKDGQDPNTLIKNADAALYFTKDLGRNSVQCYQPELNEHALERTELLIRLRLALQNKEFILNYQPLVDLNTSDIIGVEALLRWNHPSLGLIPPLTFIPMAEDSGLMIAIGEWVLRTACAQAKQWQQTSAFPKLRIAVNISARQFRNKNFVPLVKQVLEETQLNPDFLELEITESIIIENIVETVEKMNELKSLGVHFAVDDFGAGYSGLRYLKHFPFDKVKIDKAFMDNIGEDATNASIVDAIIGMTKSMGITVLAEGVENEAQLKFLQEHHGDQVQGFYFSKPLSTEECTKVLQQKLPANSTPGNRLNILLSNE